jgi:hypothetical protein
VLPSPGLAFDAYLAAHQFHKLLGDRQPEPGPAVLARGGRVRLGERLEQTGALLVCHADTRVFYLEAHRRLTHRFLLLLDTHAKHYLATLGELHGVA